MLKPIVIGSAARALNTAAQAANNAASGQTPDAFHPLSPHKRRGGRRLGFLTAGFEFLNLCPRQIAGLGAAQQQIELCGFFQFLDCVDRGIEA